MSASDDEEVVSDDEVIVLKKTTSSNHFSSQDSSDELKNQEKQAEMSNNSNSPKVNIASQDVCSTTSSSSTELEVVDVLTCGYCGITELQNQKPLRQCSRCKSIQYCCAECQTSHWKRKVDGHKAACAIAVAKAKALAVAEQMTISSSHQLISSGRGKTARSRHRYVQCPGCMNEVTSQDNSQTLSCSHQLHAACINLLTKFANPSTLSNDKIETICPLCRLKDTDTADGLFQEGLKLTMKNLHSDAILLFKAALKLDSRHACSMLFCANNLLGMGCFGEALKYYRLAILVAKGQIKCESLASLGEIYCSRFEWSNARPYIEEALEINSRDSHALELMGILHRQDKKHLKALECFRLAAKEDPTNHNLFYDIGQLIMVPMYTDNGFKISQKLFDEGVECLKRATELEPADYRAFLLLGTSLSNRERRLKQRKGWNEKDGYEKEMAAIKDLGYNSNPYSSVPSVKLPNLIRQVGRGAASDDMTMDCSDKQKAVTDTAEKVKEGEEEEEGEPLFVQYLNRVPDLIRNYAQPALLFNVANEQILMCNTDAIRRGPIDGNDDDDEEGEEDEFKEGISAPELDPAKYTFDMDMRLAQVLVKIFTHCLDLDPTVKQFAMNSVIMFKYMKRWREAAKICKRFTIIFNRRTAEVEALVNKAINSDYQDRYKKAEGFYNEAFDIEPYNFLLLYNYGKRLLRVEKYKEALPYLRDACFIHPNHADVQHYLGSCYNELAMDESKEAEALFKDRIHFADICFNNSLSIDGENTQVWSTKGIALAMHRHDNYTAYKCFENVLELDPKYRSTRTHLQWCIRGIQSSVNHCLNHGNLQLLIAKHAKPIPSIHSRKNLHDCTAAEKLINDAPTLTPLTEQVRPKPINFSIQDVMASIENVEDQDNHGSFGVMSENEVMVSSNSNGDSGGGTSKKLCSKCKVEKPSSMFSKSQWKKRANRLCAECTMY